MLERPRHTGSLRGTTNVCMLWKGETGELHASYTQHVLATLSLTHSLPPRCLCPPTAKTPSRKYTTHQISTPILSFKTCTSVSSFTWQRVKSSSNGTLVPTRAAHSTRTLAPPHGTALHSSWPHLAWSPTEPGYSMHPYIYPPLFPRVEGCACVQVPMRDYSRIDESLDHTLSQARPG